MQNLPWEPAQYPEDKWLIWKEKLVSSNERNLSMRKIENADIRVYKYGNLQIKSATTVIRRLLESKVTMPFSSLIYARALEI